MNVSDGKIRLFIADDDRAYANIMRDYFTMLPEYEVCGCVYNGRDAMHAIERQNPDVVILDLAMPYYDGLYVVDGIDKMPLQKQPFVIILSALPYNNAIARRLEENSSRYFMTKPVSLECLHDRIMSESKDSAPLPVVSHFPEDKLSMLLNRMNFAPCSKGKSCIISAVRLLDMDKTLAHALTKELYAMVGERHLNTSGQAVERSMRSAIKSAWEKDMGEAMKRVFADYGINCQERPVNGVFLMNLLDIIRK